jgi:hypothetical protein
MSQLLSLLCTLYCVQQEVSKEYVLVVTRRVCNV